jgi:hypothetical protein
MHKKKKNQVFGNVFLGEHTTKDTTYIPNLQDHEISIKSM